VVLDRRCVRLVCAGLTLAVACERDEPDYLFVTVVDGSGGALAIPQDLDAFEIRVATVVSTSAFDDDQVRFRRTIPLEGLETLPQSLSISRAEDGSGTVRVTVFGLRSGRVVQHIDRIAAFGIGRVELPPFALTPLCFGVICPLGQSCESDGVCRDGTVVTDGGTVDAGPCGPLLVACSDECVPFTDDNCGTCGTACAADERCVSNRCVCDVGLVACEDRCVDLDTSLTDCGACNTACAVTNGTPACIAGVCRVASCDAGFADCDGVASACETPLGTATDCGSCGDQCAFPNRSADCQPTGCVVGPCNAGYDDCDGNAANGCETHINSPDNCGACGNVCRIARGVALCLGGSCIISSCNGGWGDCNASYDDGCETRLDTLSNCGSCGSACDPPSATGTCGSEACVIASCDGGRADCNGSPGDGCEVNTNTDASNCGGCGSVCGMNERCFGGVCACPNNGTYEDNRGPCLPSCGHLLNMTGSPRGGNSCCPATGCMTPVVGGFQATWDCEYCCEAAVGTNACP
jgi:hypothetical protein